MSHKYDIHTYVTYISHKTYVVFFYVKLGIEKNINCLINIMVVFCRNDTIFFKIPFYHDKKKLTYFFYSTITITILRQIMIIMKLQIKKGNSSSSNSNSASKK